jgi:hypothetical protein
MCISDLKLSPCPIYSHVWNRSLILYLPEVLDLVLQEGVLHINTVKPLFIVSEGTAKK